jgi:hypothetical protein
VLQHSEKDRVKELEEENRKLQHQSESHEQKFMQLVSNGHFWVGVENYHQNCGHTK